LMFGAMPGIAMAEPGDVLWYRAYDFNPSELEANYSGMCGRQAIDGGYVLSGTYEYQNDYRRIFLIKTDDTGDTVWTKYFGWGDYDFYNRSVLVEPDGGYILVGDKSPRIGRPSPGTPIGAYMMKLDANGDTVWTSLFNDGDCAYLYKVNDICRSIEGGYIIIGWTTTTDGANDDDGFVIKVDSTGNEVWTHHYLAPPAPTGSYEVLFLSGEPAADGGYILGGKNQWVYMGDQGIVIEDYALIMKISEDGDSLWAKTFGDRDEFKELHAISSGGYIATGLDTDLFDYVRDNLSVTKIDGNLDMLWEINLYYGDTTQYVDTFTVGWSIIEDHSVGRFIISGDKQYFEGRYGFHNHPLIMQVDAFGNSITRLYIDEFEGSSITPLKIVITEEGNYLLSGYFNKVYDPNNLTLLAGSQGFMALIEGGMLTSIDDLPTPTLPERMELSQNYPNPFNAKTSIQFSLADNDNISLSIYDINGRLVKSLYEAALPAGSYNIIWDGTDESGAVVASGVYFYSMSNSQKIISKRMLMLK
jgi:hypothetical protein